MVSKDRVQILLSTFNGARFLSEQLDSILGQDYPNISLLVRDDGSSDETIELLETYQAQFADIQIIKGRNKGVTASFFELCQLASQQDTQYFAFCDQDDIWRRDKISLAINTLRAKDTPQLFVSRAQFVDENRSPLGFTTIPTRKLTLGHALVQNRFPGCTMVFNRPALDLLIRHLPDSSQVQIHDWWLYLVVAALGEVHYSAEPLVDYRQHSSNTIGLKSEGLGARLSRFRTNHKYCTLQATLFFAQFGDILDDSNRNLVTRFLSEREGFFSRVRYALSGEVYRQEFLNNLILKSLIILDRV